MRADGVVGGRWCARTSRADSLSLQFDLRPAFGSKIIGRGIGRRHQPDVKRICSPLTSTGCCGHPSSTAVGVCAARGRPRVADKCRHRPRADPERVPGRGRGGGGRVHRRAAVRVAGAAERQRADVLEADNHGACACMRCCWAGAQALRLLIHSAFSVGPLDCRQRAGLAAKRQGRHAGLAGDRLVARARVHDPARPGTLLGAPSGGA